MLRQEPKERQCHVSMRDIPQMNIENEQAGKQAIRQISRQASMHIWGIQLEPCPVGACQLTKYQGPHKQNGFKGPFYTL